MRQLEDNRLSFPSKPLQSEQYKNIEAYQEPFWIAFSLAFFCSLLAELTWTTALSVINRYIVSCHSYQPAGSGDHVIITTPFTNYCLTIFTCSMDPLWYEFRSSPATFLVNNRTNVESLVHDLLQVSVIVCGSGCLHSVIM